MPPPGERHEQLEHRQVEADRGRAPARPPAPPDAKYSPRPAHQGRRRCGARSRRPWAGPSSPRCRSRRPGCSSARAAARASAGPPARCVVRPDDHGLRGARAGASSSGASRQQHRRPGVVQHERQALARIGRVERHVGAARLEHAEQRDQQLRRALEADADQRLRPDAQRPAAAGPAVGPLVELARRSAAPSRRSAPTASGVRAAWASNSSWSRHVPRPVRPAAPFHSTSSWWRSAAVSSGSSETRGSGSATRACEQRLEVPGQPLDRRRVEQVGAVLERAARARPPSSHSEQRQVELRRAGVDRAAARAAGPAAAAARRAARSAAPKHDLEQRRAAQVALRLQLLDQPLERHVLVGVGRRASVSRTRASSSRKSGSPAQVAAQHQRVDEEADQPLDLRPVAAGDRRAHRDVVLAACSAPAAGLEAGQQRHEERGALAPAERLERLRQPPAAGDGQRPPPRARGPAGAGGRSAAPAPPAAPAELLPRQ